MLDTALEPGESAGGRPGTPDDRWVFTEENPARELEVNRADWSHIPGGVISGTALIRPDLPELEVWPFFWQQTEYVMGGGGTNFMFLALAVDRLQARWH